ncbi:MAG: thioredoxin reductase [Frankiales bacterium]|nr:thioredoxin reductase [Frankiales bacterium]
MTQPQSTFDVVVLGAGAAGLSAALVLSRAQRTVAVVDAGEPRNAPAAHMHGFLSRDGMPPRKLLAAGRAEVAGYGGTVLPGTVSRIVRTPTGFDALLTDGTRLQARRLLAATGLVDELPDIPGVRDRFGRDVLHCPYCHGYEVRRVQVGVLGGLPNSFHQVQLVRQWASDVVFFSNGSALTADQREQLVARAIGVVDGQVTGLDVQDDRLCGVVVDGVGLVRRDAVFVAPTFVPNNDVLAELGCEVDDRGWVIVDETGLTGVPGVWAAGNVVNPRAQVITAAGEGSAAAIALNNDLVEEDVRNAVVLFRLGMPV